MEKQNYLAEIKKCITFIFIKNKKGEWIPNGTGFFVGVKNEKKLDAYNIYLVTAKHVLLDKKEFLPTIAIRLNSKIGDSKLIEVSLKDIEIFMHEDKDVDIAVFNCLPDENKYDFKFIQNDLIASQEIINKHEISEGDEVFFSGLFTSHVGQKRNQPVIRFGKVALMSDEKIEWRDTGATEPKWVDLYLLECSSFGGNSGSPVFFQLNPLRKPGTLVIGGNTIFLAGVMTGTFLNGTEIQAAETKQSLFSLQNIGISAVTPAYKLYEILFSERLVGLRKEMYDCK